MDKVAAIKEINRLATKGQPFIMIADFYCRNNIVIPLAHVDPSQILYYLNGKTNAEKYKRVGKTDKLITKPIEFAKYKEAFDRVKNQIIEGNTYLLNLTFPTEITGGLNLQDVFNSSHSRYKLWVKDKFVMFSPETFIQIQDNEIASFPMKGTIDAGLPNAREKILGDEKEMAEHATIVDLIRNDMSIHASNVRVERFRYVDEIKTNSKHLLQVSSQIKGQLPIGFENRLGEIIYSLLPAGSISGAPKRKTLEIISETECYDRGFYTGVGGIYDGKNFDSAVLIRYIEQENEKLTYKSGGGIHYLSKAEEEYQEMIDKVYVPIH